MRKGKSENSSDRVFIDLFLILLRIGAGYSFFVSVFNYFMGFNSFNVLCNFVFFLFFLSMLILYGKKPHKAIELTTILFLNYFVTPVMWIHSSGTSGGVQYLFFLIVLVNSVFIVGKIKVFLLVTYIALIQLLVAIEHFNPYLLLKPGEKNREYFNSSLNLVITLILISYAIFMFVNMYNREHEKIKKMSETDHLTGIYNRKKILEILKNADSAEGRFIAIIDIDDFKTINDTLGHRSGDMLLREMVNSILKLLDMKNDSIGRFGGDEFLILFGSTDVGKTEFQLKLIEENLFKKHSINISYGLAEIKNGKSLNVSIHEADMRMYDMKQKNKTNRLGEKNDN